MCAGRPGTWRFVSEVDIVWHGKAHTSSRWSIWRRNTHTVQREGSVKTVVVSTSRYEVGCPSRVSGGFRQPRALLGHTRFEPWFPTANLFSPREIIRLPFSLGRRTPWGKTLYLIFDSTLLVTGGIRTSYGILLLNINHGKINQGARFCSKSSVLNRKRLGIRFELPSHYVSTQSR